MAPTGLVVSGLLLLILLPSPVPAQSDVINETYFLLTNHDNVTVLNAQGEVQHELINTSSYQVDFDPTSARIFWPDDSQQTINTALFNGSQRTVLHQLPSGSDPVGVAVDHILQLVFYSDWSRHLIGVTDTDGGSHRIVRNQSLTYPWALAVDVIHEFLYYTENNSPGNIGRMDYNGSSHQILSSSPYQSRDLALDVRGGRMYWSTWLDGRIESARLDGTDRTLVWQDLYQLGLAFFDGVLYFTVRGVRSIFSVNVTGINGTDLQPLPINVSGSYEGIAVYSKSQAITLEEKLAALSLTGGSVSIRPTKQSSLLLNCTDVITPPDHQEALYFRPWVISRGQGPFLLLPSTVSGLTRVLQFGSSASRQPPRDRDSFPPLFATSRGVG